MTRYRQAIALLALAGFFVSLYLWLYKIGVAGEIKCGSGGCEVVQLSRWSELLGVPVAFYGVVGYLAILGVALAGLQPGRLDRRGPSFLLAALATGGFLFSAWLTYLEYAVIHAWCRWCVASAVIMTLLWIVSLLALRTPAPRTGP